MNLGSMLKPSKAASIGRAISLRHPIFASGWIAFLGLLLAASVASARTEVLRWTHPDASSIDRFEALVGTSSNNYGSPISMGKPTPDGQGVYSASITVSDNDDVFVAVQAVGDNGQTSDPSNERFRAAPGSSGGTGETPPPSSGNDLGDGVEIPPNPNALLRFDFDSGSAAGWVDTARDNSMAFDDSLFSVTSVGGNPALHTSSTSTNIHSHFNGDPSNLTEVTVTGRMAITHADGGVGVTAYSQYPNQDIYYRLRTTRAGDTFKLYGHPNTCSNTSDTFVATEIDVWYEFEMTVTNEGSRNRITASVWRQGDSKPSSPQTECFDSTAGRPLDGTIGVWAMSAGSKYWDDLEVQGVVSTGGGAPPSGPVAAPILLSIEPVE